MIDLSDFDREFLYLRDYARQRGGDSRTCPLTSMHL